MGVLPGTAIRLPNLLRRQGQDANGQWQHLAAATTFPESVWVCRRRWAAPGGGFSGRHTAACHLDANRTHGCRHGYQRISGSTPHRYVFSRDKAIPVIAHYLRSQQIYILDPTGSYHSGRSQRRSSRFILQFRRPKHPGVSSGCSTQRKSVQPGRTSGSVRRPRHCQAPSSLIRRESRCHA